MSKENKKSIEEVAKQLQKKLGEELKNRRRGAGLTQNDVAIKLDVNPKTLSSYETGRVKPSFQFLTEAAKLYGISPSVFAEASREIAFPVNNLIKIPVLSAKTKYRDRREFFMANDPIRYEYADVGTPEDYVFLVVPDNSMRDYRLLEGDAILIRKGQDPEDGDMVAALVGGYPAIMIYQYLSETSFNLKPGDASGNKTLLVKDGEANGKKVELLGVKRLAIIY